MPCRSQKPLGPPTKKSRTHLGKAEGAVERSPDEAAEKFRQYLANESVASGESLRAARTEYHNLNRRSQAKAAIPEAWRELVQKRDSSLIEIHPNDGGFRVQHEKLPGGWLVATHLSNDLKRRVIDLAAETAGWPREDIVLPF